MRENLTNRINAELARIKMSETAFARRIGLDQGHLNRIKNGRVVPTLLTALKIASALNQPLDQIFWLKEDRR